jgi:16S rRNA (adenine1518-N6/adenine1519-N6)-dimethyltransferase
MGQNFLADAGMASAIIEKSGISSNDLVVEIGAGLGAMTIPLCARAKHVFAVEPDEKIAALLHNELSAAGASNVTIVQRDILKCDLQAITDSLRKKRTENRKDRLKVVGNLPYHISSPVLVYLVDNRRLIKSALLMFQKELADRLQAAPGSKSYGRLSVLLSYCADVQTIAQVPAAAFHPRPKVDSTVIEILFRDIPLFEPADERFLFLVVKAAFGKRRKMLKNALKAGELNLSDSTVSWALEKAGIHPGRRAETLSVKEFVRLADYFRAFQSEL